jgi:uncharacterized protein (TIGR02453 family)
MATPLHEFPPFPGFSDDALAFLRGLQTNNYRDWFEARRSIYEDEVRFPLKCLIADVARRLRDTDLPLTGHPNTSRFRIYRDLRFTDDNRPYKTNLGAVFDRSGEKDAPGVVYVHVEPGASFLAGGFYQPSVSYLKPIREAIADDPARFHAMLNTMEERDLPVTSMDDTLTGMPRGFSAHRDTEIAPHLKWQHLVTRRPIEDAHLQRPDFAAEVVAMAQDCRPLLEYVWQREPENVH